MPITYEHVFSKSPEVAVSAVRKPTKMDIWLSDPAETTRYEGKTVTVGTQIKVGTALWREPWFTSLGSKKHIIYHRLNTGTWEKIGEGTASTLGEFSVIYTVTTAGKHSFYAEFPGDAEYEGCTKAVRVFAK